MAFENTAGLNVHNQYGPRDTGSSIGVETGKDSIQQMSVELTHNGLIDGFLPPFHLPAGAKVLRYLLRVDQAFTLTGTTPTVQVGGTAPGTNGITLTAAELAAVGTKIPASSGSGTWATSAAAYVTATERVKVQLGGTTPAVTPGAGQATLLVEYVYKNRTVS